MLVYDSKSKEMTLSCTQLSIRIIPQSLGISQSFDGTNLYLPLSHFPFPRMSLNFIVKGMTVLTKEENSCFKSTVSKLAR